MGETPAKQLAVASRKKKPRTGKFLSCADESLYIFVCLTDGMTKKANDGGVPGNSSVVFYDSRGPLRCGVFQFSGSIMTVHVLAQPVAAVEVCFGGGPDHMALDRNSERIALHARQMFADVVAKLGIQGERPCVKASLNQADTWEISLARALMHRVHQAPANRAILHRWIDGNRPNPGDSVTFVEKIAPDDPTVFFRMDKPC